jgi:hypothetical protein
MAIAKAAIDIQAEVINQIDSLNKAAIWMPD